MTRAKAASASAPSAKQSAANLKLRTQLEEIRAERDKLLDRQARIAELLKSSNPEKVLHDLRNVLNELQLYKLLLEKER